MDFDACFTLLMGQEPAVETVSEPASATAPVATRGGFRPFPWQRRLYDMLCAGRLPDVVDIPTGLGKTAVIAIWLIARAKGAPVPRRLVYVVDRRAIVDQATEVAARIAARLDTGSASPLAADLRAGLDLGDDALPVSTLRGQYADNRVWSEDPTRPAIIVGTVDMIGSRLLFGGYGVSPKMRPVHAGLLAHDSLIVLDEAHLSRPFEAMLETAPTLFPYAATAPLPPRTRLLSLTATARSAGAKTVFGLDAADEAEEDVIGRLKAPKPLTLEIDAAGSLEEALAEAAWSAGAAASRRVLVFCDRRDSAVKVHGEIEKRLNKDKRKPKDHLALMTGERRVRERQDLAGDPIYRRFLGDAPPAADEASLFLIATSAGEVGVDFDADAMVCDVVAFERMIQRIGRVNRRGRAEPAPVTVIAQPTAKEKPEDAQARATRLAALALLPRDPAGTLDASVDGFRALKARAVHDPAAARTIALATTEEPFRPALTEALVEAWSLTGLAVHAGRPKDLGPWLRGWIEDEPQTTVVWRRWLPWRAFEPEPKRREVEDFFEAAPVHLTETLEAPVYRVVDTLKKLVGRWQKREAAATAVEAPSTIDDGLRKACALLLGCDGTLEGYWTAPALAGVFEHPRRREAFERSLAGRTLVLQADLGGIDENGLLKDPKDPVPEVVRTLDGDDVWGEDIAVQIRFDAVKNKGDHDKDDVAAPSAAKGAPRWKVRFSFDISPEDTVGAQILVEQRRDRLSEDWRRSLSSLPQRLDAHQNWVRRAAVRAVRRLALGADVETAFARAALLHDLGKARKAWQDHIGAPETDRPFAKGPGTKRQIVVTTANGERIESLWRGARPNLLEGYRHEFGSLLTARDDEDLGRLADDLRDLALHLIASHHGYARPTIPAKLTPPPARSDPGAAKEIDLPEHRLEPVAREAMLRFARLTRRWGPWGLAWWEALFRSADWAASRWNDDGRTEPPPCPAQEEIA